MESKIHVRVVLDVFVRAESAVDVATRLREACSVEIENMAGDDVMYIESVNIVDAVVTDSR